MRICEINKDKHVLREKDLLDYLRNKNEHIIKLCSTFKDETNLYFVFEHAPNGSLDDLIRACRNKLGEDIVRILFAQLINFLEFIQKENIMHRDLKPMNIMVSANFNLKIIDFGDAKRVNEASIEEEPSESSVDHNVRRGTFVGTMNY